MLKANPDCCQEAAMGMPGGGYFPCNKPATKIVRWKGRPDAPLRMCDACADHNVRNRGGFVVSQYPPSDTVETQPAAVLRKSRVRNRQRTNYSEQLLLAYESRLSSPHYVILVAAAEHRSSTEAIADALGLTSLGTVKSRLNRARAALAALIDEDDAERRAKNEMQPGGLLADPADADYDDDGNLRPGVDNV